MLEYWVFMVVFYLIDFYGFTWAVHHIYEIKIKFALLKFPFAKVGPKDLLGDALGLFLCVVLLFPKSLNLSVPMFFHEFWHCISVFFGIDANKAMEKQNMKPSK